MNVKLGPSLARKLELESRCEKELGGTMAEDLDAEFALFESEVAALEGDAPVMITNVRARA